MRWLGIVVVALSACAPDIPVKSNAEAMIGKPESALAATFGPSQGRVPSEDGKITDIYYIYTSSATAPGSIYTQCRFGVCLTTTNAPYTYSNTCTVAYTVTEGIVRSYRTEGGCK